METILNYLPFGRGIHWSPVNSPSNGACMFSLVWAMSVEQTVKLVIWEAIMHMGFGKYCVWIHKWNQSWYQACKSIINNKNVSSMLLNYVSNRHLYWEFLRDTLSTLNSLNTSLASPGHQQPWYWLSRIGMSLSYMRKDFNNLCHVNVEQ